jgi:DNA-directed RNA polymerase specialized sigma24 family protein
MHGRSGERALFEAIARGDAASAPELSLRLLPVIEAAQCRLLGGRGASHAERVACSLRRLIAELSRHPHPWVCSLASWATAVSAQVAVAALQARPRSRLSLEGASELEGPAAAGATSASASRQVGLALGIAQLRVLLGELPTEQAHVVALHDVMGMPVQDVAITLAVSLETLARRLKGGREQLGRRLRSISGGATTPERFDPVTHGTGASVLLRGGSLNPPRSALLAAQLR